MAADVDKALVEVIAKGAGLNQTAAKQKLAELAKAGRYQRDVY